MARTTLLVFGLLISTAFLAALAPTASAQTTRLTIEPDGMPEILDDDYRNRGLLVPETGSVHVRFTFKVTVATGSFCLQPITVKYHGRAVGPADDWATMVLDRTAESHVYQGPFLGAPVAGLSGDEIRGFSVTATITTTRAAPAFVDGLYDIVASAHAANGLQSGCSWTDSDPTLARIMIRNDYLPRMAYQVVRSPVSAAPHDLAEFEVVMTNVGNGATRVQPSLVKPIPSCVEDYRLPTETIVPSLAQSPTLPNAASVSLFIVPATSGPCPVTVELRGSTDNLNVDALVDVQTLSLVVNAEGDGVARDTQAEGHDLPGFDPLFLAIGLGVVGSILRRRER